MTFISEQAKVIGELHEAGSLTKEKVLSLLDEDPFNYIHLPPIFKEDMYIKEYTVRGYPGLVRHVGWYDPALLEIAVDTSPLALRFIPFSLRSDNLVKKAISVNYKAVVHATYEQKQEEAFVRWCLDTNLDTAPILAKANPTNKLLIIALFWLKNKQ